MHTAATAFTISHHPLQSVKHGELRHLPSLDRSFLSRIAMPHTTITYPPFIEPILIQLNPDPTQLIAKLNPNTLTLLDKTNQVVHKIALTQLGADNLEVNHTFLTNSNFADKPKAIKHQVIDSSLVTTESLIPGKNLKPSQLTTSMLNSIFTFLKPLYQPILITTTMDQETSKYQNRSKLYSPSIHKLLSKLSVQLSQKFPQNANLICSPIHGDLTHDNIILNQNTLSFIDFDRTCTSFPEHDAFLLDIYSRTKQSNQVNHFGLFNQIIQLLNNPAQPLTIQALYHTNPHFSHNNNQLPFLKALFAYRLFVLTLENQLPDQDSNHLAQQLTTTLQS